MGHGKMALVNESEITANRIEGVNNVKRNAKCEVSIGNLQDRLWGPKLGFFRFFGRFGPLHGPFDLSTKAVALSHQGACIREVRNFCHWASCRDPNLLNWDLGRTSPWTPIESTDPLNSGGCDSSRLGSPNGRSCKLPVPSLTIPTWQFIGSQLERRQRWLLSFASATYCRLVHDVEC